uniref:C2H2-type domain-containing protein n=1 Tax=Branchiostoma floridae TaxID=7739 RepID=C3ZAX3_BRAFL|eukprot:XP_002593999.1 hypothetical protein BRAFLDRAFT_68562 [Branchiostoma floridae]
MGKPRAKSVVKYRPPAHPIFLAMSDPAARLEISQTARQTSGLYLGTRTRLRGFPPLIKELLQSSAREQTGTIRTPGTQQTLYCKEKGDQEKNLDTSDNNMTSSQLSCGIDIKEEELGDLENSLVNCCNSTAQLLSSDALGTDAEEEDGQRMKPENCYNTSTSPQLSCTDDTVEDQQEMDPRNCYNNSTVTSPQQSCRTVGTVENQQEMNCYTTNTQSQLKEDELFHDSDGSMSSCDSDQLERTERQLQRKIWRKNSWVCECGEKFKNMASYHKHILEEHPVTCDYCEEKFHSAKTLQKHLKTHLPSEDKLDLNGDKLSMCDHCGQFFTKQQMKRHKVKISDLRPYRCDVKNCASAFKTKGALKNHVRKVHERNRFPCQYEGCEKTFGIKSVLLKHYKVHTDERSHQCSYCGRMFQRTDHLKVHMRQHTGDTPFNCSLCNYSGRQSNCLIWHMKTHHPELFEKSGDKKGAKQRKKKSGLEKDDEKGSKKGAKARKTSGLEMDDKMGAKKGAKPSNKVVLKKDALVDKVDSSKTLGSAKKKKALAFCGADHSYL